MAPNDNQIQQERHLVADTTRLKEKYNKQNTHVNLMTATTAEYVLAFGSVNIGQMRWIVNLIPPSLSV